MKDEFSLVWNFPEIDLVATAQQAFDTPLTDYEADMLRAVNTACAACGGGVLMSRQVAAIALVCVERVGKLRAEIESMQRQLADAGYPDRICYTCRHWLPYDHAPGTPCKGDCAMKDNLSTGETDVCYKWMPRAPVTAGESEVGHAV